MNRHVNAISGRLSLRQPQRRSLEILDRDFRRKDSRSWNWFNRKERRERREVVCK